MLLSFDKADASPTRTKALTDGNYVLCFFFIVEICLRWAAAGFRFWTDGFNAAEAVLAIVSLLDAGAQFTGADSRHPLLFVLHSTRSLRILRIARFYKGWLKVLETIVKAVPRATSALALLIVFLLTASVVGMQVCKSWDLRSCRKCVNSMFEQIFGGGYASAVTNGYISSVPNLNFNTIYWAFITSYEVSDNGACKLDRVLGAIKIFCAARLAVDHFSQRIGTTRCTLVSTYLQGGCTYAESVSSFA